MGTTRLAFGRLFVAVALLVLLPVPAAANRYNIHTYREIDGLPNQKVYGIAQTPDGVIWLATRQGLVSYDGLVWTSIPSDHINYGSDLRDVAVDERGRVWTASSTIPSFISWREGGRWHHLPTLPNQERNWYVDRFDVATAPDGSSWVAVTTTDQQLFIWDGGRWSSHGRGAAIGRVFSIHHHGDRFLLATASGMWTLEMSETATLRRIPGSSVEPVYSIAVTPEGGMWVVGDGFAIRRNTGGRETRYDFPRIRTDEPALKVSATADSAGGLWVATPWEVSYFHPDRGLEVLDRDSGLSWTSGSDVLIDREHNVWISSHRGVSKIVSRQVCTLDHHHGLFDDEVSAVLRLGDGRMVLGHAQGLTYLEDPARQMAFDVVPRVRSRVMDLVEDADGSLWIAMDHQGLAKLEPDGRVEWQRSPLGPGGAVYALFVDPDGVLWVGGNHGLSRRVDGSYETIPLPGGAGGQFPFVRRISGAASGGIYVMTGRHGVLRLHRDQLQSWRSGDNRAADGAFCALEHPDGSTWIGTANGAYRLGLEQLEPVPELESLVRRPVYAIEMDLDGRVWLGTDAGVRIWDGTTIKSVRVGDGLAGPEVNRDAMWCDPDGTMWVGTDRGVTRFEAGFLTEPRVEPLVEFLGFELDGEPISANGPIRRRGPVSLLVACFRGISFIDERRIRYRTWLEGFESDWQPLVAAPMRELRYTNLPSGTYRFHVQAVAPQGETSRVAVSAPLEVVPPIWLTWWFLTGVAISVAVLIGVLTALLIGQRNARRLATLVRDRTEQLNELEQAARAEAVRMSTTLQSISDGVLAADTEGRIILANHAAAEMLGDDADRLSGRRLVDLLPALGENWASTGAPVEVIQPTESGRDLVLEATVAPLETIGNLESGQVIALRDVTDRRRYEEEMTRAQRLESLGVLAGGIAHDFNNLLTVILGHSSLLEAADLGPSEASDVSRIRLSTEKAQALTQQLLTFARGGEPKLEPTDLEALIADAESLALSGANVTCRRELDDDLRPAMIDADQVGQALNNLLLNACQAMPHGGTVTIIGHNLIELPDWLEPGNYVELIVSDEGPGLSPEVLKRVFEPFFTTKADGSGLGLAVAYSVAHRHGGSLSGATAPGGGAVFTLVLPAAEGREPRSDTDAPQPKPRTGRVLIMDDEAAVRLVLKKMFTALGSEVVETDDGEDAVSAWQAAMEEGRSFDLAVLDLTVPAGMGGQETIKRLHEIDPGVRALVVSGYSNDPVLADPKAYGFAGAIMKPFDMKSLARAVEATLDDG